MAAEFFAPKEWHMYQMNPAPEKRDLQEYISDYCRSHDDKFLAAFLHRYEDTLNQNVLSYMRRFFMMEHFADMKQAYVTGLLKALKHYDIEQGAKFTSFKERYVEREILNYVRSTRTGFTAQSLAEYAKLRKAMAIWDRYDRDYSDETLLKIVNELGESVTATKEILLGGLLNEHQAEMYRQYLDSDGEDGLEEVIADGSSNPYIMYEKSELYDRLWEAFDNLEYEERKILSQRYGFCLDCHSVYFHDTGDLDENGEPKNKLIPQMMYTDIATDHEYSSANTVQRKCRKALDKLRREIEELM